MSAEDVALAFVVALAVLIPGGVALRDGWERWQTEGAREAHEAELEARRRARRLEGCACASCRWALGSVVPRYRGEP